MSALYDQAYENMRDLEALREREDRDFYHGHPDFADDVDELTCRALGAAEKKPGRTGSRRAVGERMCHSDPGPSAAPSVTVEVEGHSFHACPKCLGLYPDPGVCWRCRL